MREHWISRLNRWAEREAEIAERLSKKENWTPELEHAYHVGIAVGIFAALVGVMIFLRIIRLV